MKTTPSDKEGRSDPPSELGFVLAPPETDPIPVLTHSSEVSRLGPASTMVAWSRARDGRGVIVIPETQFEPEIEMQREQEIQVSIPATSEGGLGAARPSTADTASQYITADRPEATSTFTTRQEISRHFSTWQSQSLPPHVWHNMGNFLCVRYGRSL